MPVDTFATLPDPSEAGGLDDLVERLRLLKIWAGDPSYETIKDRVNAAWTAAGRPASELTVRSTVAHCFQAGRRRLNTDLVVAVVQALHPDTEYVTRWQQALRVVGGEIEAVSQVRVQDTLPQELTAFTGRMRELDQLRHALRRATRDGGAVVISAIEGMAGVGKTQLAVHAGHLLLREGTFDRVLFVNLRGFHPDPSQPPADPAAVLDGFLRLLGTPSQQIPHGLPARAAAYRARLTGIRALIVLDNAATAEQARPLLPATPGCLTLITSRRNLADLHPATRLTVDVFTPAEATAFLANALAEVPVGSNPDAAALIARRCGYLPLALSLITGHIRNTPGWTLTDHADRLGERHHDRRLDTGIELALDLSYRHLPADQQRLLRLLALHPGQDFDGYAAAALADSDLKTAQVRLNRLCADHVLQLITPGRYAFHDLVRSYADTRAHDEERPSERRAALTRLFDLYLATSAAAMNIVHPAAAHWRPPVPPAGTPAPELTDSDAAIAWLDNERHTLVPVAAYTAAHGWPGYATRLARVLSPYLHDGHHADALTVHGHAHHAARTSGDLAAQAHALRDIGYVHLRAGPLEKAAEYFRQALDLFRRTDDHAGQARALHNLGIVADRSGSYPTAIDNNEQALSLYRQAGDQTGETTVLVSLGISLQRVGRLPEAIGYFQDSLALARQSGNQRGEAYALNCLGEAETRAGRYGPARDHLQQALALFRQLRNRTGEGSVLDSLGILHTRLGQPDRGQDYHERALAIFRESKNRDSEAWVLNGLGEAAHAAGRAADALTHYAVALAIATDIGARTPQARAHSGLGRAHHALGNHAQAREHHQQALIHYTDLGLPEAEQIRILLVELDNTGQRQPR
jgi:tetratricopeptide (TPR) repeat protein